MYEFYSELIKEKPSRGVTLIELILVVSIMLILAVSVSAMGSNFLYRNDLQNTTNEIIASLRSAQINSMSGKADSSWGVTYSGNEIVLFKGDNFATRDQGFDETYKVSGRISISGFEIVFDKLTGNASAMQGITISNEIGESHAVSINNIGIVDVN